MCSIMGYCGSSVTLDKFKKGFERTVSRGPDASRIIDTGKGLLGFHRLSIMGLTPSGMQPFELNVQAAERTLVDKVFALGDYYLSDAVREHSRHVYDIYKLLDVVTLDDSMKELAQSVREERKPHVNCRSAKEGIDMNALLQEIIDKAIYKQDYEEITEKILFEEVPYETAASALQTILESGIFA